MNRAEQRELSAMIKVIIGSNLDSWKILKEQILDYGYQSFYPAQDIFHRLAVAVIKAMNEKAKQRLIALWRDATPRRPVRDANAILERYASIIVEEIVRRARVAAYRTRHL